MPIIVVAILVRRHCLHFRLLVLHHHFTRFVSVLIEESKSAKYSNIGPLAVAGSSTVLLCSSLRCLFACSCLLPPCLTALPKPFPNEQRADPGGKVLWSASSQVECVLVAYASTTTTTSSISLLLLAMSSVLVFYFVVIAMSG